MGNIRGDGMIFWQYIEGKEYWVGEDKFLLLRQRKNAEARSRRDNDVWRAASAIKSSEYYKKNKETLAPKLRKRAAEYYLKNKEIVLKKQAERYCIPEVGNRAREGCRKRNKSLAGRARLAAKDAKRRAIKLMAPTEDSNEIRFLYAFCSALSRGGVKHHVDHITPLSRGGTHNIDNLRIIPAIVNLKKGCRIAA